MANNINAIGINTQALNYAQMHKADKKDGAVKDSAKEQQPAVSKKDIPAADVLSYMAAQSVDVKPAVKKTLDVSKYVTPEQSQRIAGFVQGFQSEVEKGLQKFDTEFPNANLSDQSKMNFVLDAFNKSNDNQA